MVKRYNIFISFILIAACSSCSSIHAINQLPADTYLIKAKHYNILDTAKQTHEVVKMDVEQISDTVLKFTPLTGNAKPFIVNLWDIKELKLHRNTFDVDVLTVPFKIRPSVKGFPEQLNADFDAALYLGRRRDNYTIKNVKTRGNSKLQLTGAGYGYGGFIGLGSVTMNPYVTQPAIDYEYNGFVLNGGLAGIYDAKRFNIGLAIGTDFLVDKNRSSWIYHGKPWVGVLFGIDLN
jgi:ABC-type transport system substrate-binding protein